MSYSTVDSAINTAGLKATITSEKNVSIEYVVNEATTIWRIAKSRDLIFGDPAVEKFMDEMTRAYPEFSKSYPIVFRYICQMQEYDAKAFKYWLMKIKNNPWKTEAAYLDAQADYVAVLYKTKFPRCTAAQIRNIQVNIRAALESEHKKFKQCAEEQDRAVTELEDFLKGKNAEELLAFTKLAGARGMSTAEKLWVETDLAGGAAADIDELAGALPRECAGGSEDLLS